MKRALATALVSILIAVPAAEARPGALDPSFGRNGKVVRQVRLGAQAWDAASTGIAKLPGGRSVVLAGRTLLGLMPDGTPWRGFGGGAVRITAPGGSSLKVIDVAADSRGRVLVGGTTFTVPPRAEPPVEPVVTDGRAFIARYTPAGTLDPSFGAGGVVITELGLAAPQVLEKTPAPPGPQVGFRGLAVDAADRVVLTGLRTRLIGPCRSFSSARYQEGFAARLTEDGAIDPAFGEAGHTLFPGLEEIDPPAVDRAGEIYVSGLLWEQCNPISEPRFVARLEPDGRPDLAFNGDGSLRLPSASPRHERSLALDRAGRPLLLDHRYLPRTARNRGHMVALVRRITRAGEPDRSFGRNGAATLAAIRDHSFVASAIAASPNGKIVLAGTSWPVRSGATPRSFMVGRLTTGGLVDRRFGGDGRVTTRFGARAQAQASSLAIVGRGRPLVAGTLSRPSLRHGEGLALARYQR